MCIYNVFLNSATTVPLIISPAVLAKLAGKARPVTPEEIEECFATRTGVYLIDDREEHASDPPTRWFISETYFGRKLKIAFIPRGADIHIRSAFDANQKWIEIYDQYHSS